MSRNKVITADAAAGLVLDRDTIATTGFVGTGFPEELALALERRFLDTGAPRDLTLVFAAPSRLTAMISPTPGWSRCPPVCVPLMVAILPAVLGTLTGCRLARGEL